MRSRARIQQVIILLSIIMILGHGNIMMVNATETPKQEIKLTESFLTGTWVCAEGFVCSYRPSMFFTPSGFCYWNCEINNDVLIGTTASQQTVSTKITVIDNDTIQVLGYTAVRAESKLGKEYQEQFMSLLVGKWVNYDEDYEVCLAFKKDNSLVLSSDVERTFHYELTNGGIEILNSGDTEEEREVIYARIHDDILSFCDVLGEAKFYREGSDVSKSLENGKTEVDGEWIFVSEDEKPISQWKFDSSDTVTIDYFSKGKNIQQPFSISRKGSYIVVCMGGKIYNLQKTYSFVEVDNYEVSGDLDGNLVRKDSEEGKYYIKKAKTIYKKGKVIQRTKYKKFNDNLYPEVTAISLSMKCMSNVWLDDVININTKGGYLNQLPGICGQSYEIVCNTALKDASITFSYDESQLPYAYEKDLVIVRMDEKTGKKTMLKTTRNLKLNKVAAKITKGGIYYLADSVVMKGGTRDIYKRNPKSTEWARLNDTGDILSLIDLQYIKESQGSFSVSTVSQLASVVYYVNTTPNAMTWIYLTKDIDLSGYDWAPMGWDGPNGLKFAFEGLIDGWNFTISNLHMDILGDNVGFIGYAPNAGVRNLKITNAFIRGKNYVGVVAGISGCGYYDNCNVNGEVYGNWAGSMMGDDSNSEFRDCTANVTVNGKKFEFLTSKKKQPCKVEVKDYSTITMDKTDTFQFSDVSSYDNLSWSVYHNGFRVKDIDAKKYDSIRYHMDEPGYYKIYLCTYRNGQYIRVSNVIEKMVD